ncbi:recombinase RecA [Candidatus Kuenenbacteria bacterium]|nr:recombinase RecA [Candidatus Kuenenbacteria bacterium]
MSKTTKSIDDGGKTERQKAAEAAIDQIKTKFGEGSIMKLGEAHKMKVEVLPTGCFSLDLALGVGGLPKGRMTEIYGAEASGKTTLALHAVAEAQKRGGTAAYVDVEHALDPDYAKKIGVKVDDLLISQPDTGEQALEIVETLIRSNGVDIVVIDSVAALVPRAEIEGEMGDQNIALQARLMSKAMRKLSAVISETKTVVIFINQTRMRIGFFFGNPETTTGGMALKFYASIRIELKRLAQLKKGEQIIGNKVKAKIVKNKVAPPFKVCEFEILYNEGISHAGDLLNMGLEHGSIKKTGNTFSFGETKLGVGEISVKEFLKGNPKIAEELKKKILEKIAAGVV